MRGSVNNILLIGAGVTALYLLSKKTQQSNISPQLAQQYTTSPNIQKILTTAPNAGDALTNLQAWYATPLNPLLDGNVANNPPENALNQKLINLGVPITSFANNPAQQARSYIGQLQKQVGSAQDQLNRHLLKFTKTGVDFGIASDRLAISTLQSQISAIQAII